MPNDVRVWITLIVVLGVVIFLVLRFRGSLGIKWGNKSLDVQPTREPNKISVADGAEFKRAEVGNVVGRKSEGNAKPPSAGETIEVMHQAKVEDSKLGDITGVSETGKQEPKQRQ